MTDMSKLYYSILYTIFILLYFANRDAYSLEIENIDEENIGRAVSKAGNCSAAVASTVVDYTNYHQFLPTSPEPMHSNRLRTLAYCGSTYCSNAISCCNSATNPCCTLQPGTGTCCPDMCYTTSNAVCCGNYACITGYSCCSTISGCCLTTQTPTVVPTYRPPTFRPSTRNPTVKPSTIAPTTRTPSYTPTVRPPTVAPSTRSPTIKPTTAMPTFRPPTASPSAPVRPPVTAAPTLSYTLNTWTSCPAYSITSSTASATMNVAYCSIQVCPGQRVTASLCSTDAGVCSGDTYLRVYNATGGQIAYSDDYCSACSKVTFNVTTSSCSTYQIAEGCYSTGSCSGTVRIYIASYSFAPTASPTLFLTALPTTAYPSVHPTTAAPSLTPTTASPTTTPPTYFPTYFPTSTPTSQPSTSRPTSHPSSSQPTSQPTSSPSHFVFPAESIPSINDGEITAAVFGSLAGVCLMALLLYKKQYEESIHILMSVGDIITDMMFVKQLKLRVDYLRDMTITYQSVHDTSLYAKELDITSTIFAISLVVILAFCITNFIAAFVFGNPHFYFHSIMQYGIVLLNKDLKSYFINPYQQHISHIYSSDDHNYDNDQVFLPLPFMLTWKGVTWWCNCEESSGASRTFRAAFLFLWPAHALLVLFVSFCVFLLFLLKLFSSLLIMIFLTAIVYAGNAAIFMTCMCTSEINFHFYGRPNGSPSYYFWMTTIGVYFEDLPQLLIQSSYAAVLWNVFSIRPSPLQIGSFAFTAWKIQFGLTYKVFTLFEKTKSKSPDIVVTPQLSGIINDRQEFRIVPTNAAMEPM